MPLNVKLLIYGMDNYINIRYQLIYVCKLKNKNVVGPVK